MLEPCSSLQWLVNTPKPCLGVNCEIGSSLKLQVGFNNSINNAIDAATNDAPLPTRFTFISPRSLCTRLRLNGRWGPHLQPCTHSGQWRSRQYGPNMPIRRVGSRYSRLLHLVACRESIEAGQIPYGNPRRGRGRKKIY